MYDFQVRKRVTCTFSWLASDAPLADGSGDPEGDYPPLNDTPGTVGDPKVSSRGVSFRGVIYGGVGKNTRQNSAESVLCVPFWALKRVMYTLSGAKACYGARFCVLKSRTFFVIW